MIIRHCYSCKADRPIKDFNGTGNTTVNLSHKDENNKPVYRVNTPGICKECLIKTNSEV